MSFKVEELEKSMAKLTIEVTAEELEEAIERAYKKNRNQISVQGFRKGKAPRAIIEKMYGESIFYEDAANDLIPDAYEKAALESDLEIVSRPNIQVEQIEAGKPFIFTAEVAIKPEVTLGMYKGIEVEKREVEVTEEEIGERIEQEREQNARMIVVEDRPVQDGDITVIDFEGFQDGEPFEGGKGEDFSLTIGSKSFIDGFEEQLIGKELNVEHEINVTFPEEYHAEDLAGKDAMFKVTIKEIKEKELPELDDDFAQDVSEFDTLDEYKESIRATIEEGKVRENKTAIENEIVDKIIEEASMEIPEPMIQTQTSQLVEDMAQRMQQQGLSIDQYLQITGMDVNQLFENFRPQALKRIQSRLVLEAIVKAEDIKASEEDFQKEIENMAKMYGVEADKVKEMIGENEKEMMMLDIAVQKAVDLVAEEAKEV